MTKKNKALVLEIIKDHIKSQIITDTGHVLPVGYTPIEKIRGALFVWCQVPFNGTDIWCQLRCPNATQLEQCGDVSNIVIKDEKSKEITSYDDIIKIRNYQEEVCKIVFNIPTFDHILSLVGRDDFVISEKRIELEKIKKQFDENKKNMTEIEKSVIDNKIKTLNLQLGFILPDDTMAFVCKWAMGNDISDIKKLTRDSLLKAASLAKAHNKAPSDYLSGVFTDFNKHEIDTYAFTILEDYLRDKKTVDSGKHRWFLGGRHNEDTITKTTGK